MLTFEHDVFHRSFRSVIDPALWAMWVIDPFLFGEVHRRRKRDGRDAQIGATFDQGHRGRGCLKTLNLGLRNIIRGTGPAEEVRVLLCRVLVVLMGFASRSPIGGSCSLACLCRVKKRGHDRIGEDKEGG